MLKIKIIFLIIILIFFSVSYPASLDASKKVFYPLNMENEYAVLIAGGYNSANNHARYWNDIGEAYQILKQYGYTDKNIIVFYANGNYPNSSNCHNWLSVKQQYSSIQIDYAATKSNLKNAIASIPHSKSNGLFVFSTDHGMADGSLVLWGEFVSPEEFSDIFSPTLGYRMRVFEFEQCYSGAFLAPLSSKNTIIVTASTDAELSWALPPDYGYDSFNFFFNSALKGSFPEGYTYPISPSKADVDRDGRISIAEAFNYVSNLINFDLKSTPWYSESEDGIPITSTVNIIGTGSLGDLTHLGVMTIIRPEVLGAITTKTSIEPSSNRPLYLKELNLLLEKLEYMGNGLEDSRSQDTLRVYNEALKLKESAEEDAKGEKYLQARNKLRRARDLLEDILYYK